MSLADYIRTAAWTHGNALRRPEIAKAVADAWDRPPEPTGVVIADGDVLRTDRVFRVIEDGRERELRLRVARGVMR